MKLESMPNTNEQHAVKESRETITLPAAKTAATKHSNNSNNDTNQRAANNNCHNDATKADDEDDADDDDHHVSYVRVLKIPRAAPSLETYGFHLTRSKWDPYPWINAIDVGTPAAQCGLKAGDCVLEVNGINVLGMRIAEIAKLVRNNNQSVTLTLWSTNCQAKCNPESICCAPMPSTLQRLSAIVQSILSIIECPVCLETITPPAMQCQNGHLLCVNCRIRAEKCPVCRDHYTPRRSLIAEKIYATITNAFDLCHNEDKLRYKLFGRARLQQQLLLAHMQHNGNDQRTTLRNAMAGGASTMGRQRKARLPTNKFLTKLLHKKAYSLDNLTSSSACKLLAANAVAEHTTVSKDNCRHSIDVCEASTLAMTMTANSTATSNATTTTTTTATAQSCSNQFHCRTNARNRFMTMTRAVDARQTGKQLEQQHQQQQQDETQSMTATRLTTTASMTLPKMAIAAAAATAEAEAAITTTQPNAISKHYSLSSNDLQATEETQQQLLNEMPTTMQTLPRTTLAMTMNTKKNNNSDRQTAATAANVSNSIRNNKNRMALFYADKRRSCKSLSSSIECIRRSSLQHDFQMDSTDKATMATVATVRPFVVARFSAGPELLKLTASDAKMFDDGTKASDMQVTTKSCDENVKKNMPATTTQTTQTTQTTTTKESSKAASATIASPTSITFCAATAKVQSMASNQQNLPRPNPCPCYARFTDSAQLQHHVKVSHGLCVGGSTTQLTLPLEHAQLSLELNAYKNDGATVKKHSDYENHINERTEKRNGTDCASGSDGSANENDDAATNECLAKDEHEVDYEVARIKVRIETDKLSRECWISVKMQGRAADGNDTTAKNAIYEASSAERVHFAMTAFCAQQKQPKAGQLNGNEAKAPMAATC